jgi:8-oxo-dGTP diphosphatase
MSSRPARKGTTPPKRIGTICFDFDGVLHESPEWAPVMGRIDVTPIEQALKRGYSCAVMTCNDVRNVAAELNKRGIHATPDPDMRHASWHGGQSGKEVLVTGRKLTARYYVDDRAIHYRYGDGPSRLWATIAGREEFRYCTDGKRHWGANGAAGVLPWTVADGTAYVLLGLRSGMVQEGRTWSIWGGAIDREETALQAAEREFTEELSDLKWDLGSLTYEHVAECPAGCGWSYTTFALQWDIADVPNPVHIRDTMETTQIQWVEVSRVATMQLHSGFRAAWPILWESIEL